MSAAVLAEPAPAVRHPAAPVRTRVPWRLGVPLLAALVLLAPSIVWVFRNHVVWPFDQAWYGEVSCDLWFYLRRERAWWKPAMLHALQCKAPGIVWAGQFFVPLGKYVGSIDRALLLSVLLAQFGTLALLWRMGKAFCRGQGTGGVLAGCLAVASAPLFVGLSHQFFAEPLQTLAVTWAFAIAVFGRRWPRLLTLANLLGAAAVGMLAKTTTPLYCFAPGLVALAHFIWPKPEPRRRPWVSTAAHLGLLGLSLCLCAATLWWYHENLGYVREHMRQSATGEVALAYGHKGTFLAKLPFWLAAYRDGLATPNTAWLLIALVLLAIAVRGKQIWRDGLRSAGLPDVVALAALAQVLTMLVVMPLMITEETRFLLPTLPALGLTVTWAVAQLRARTAAALVALVFAVQWVDVTGIAAGAFERKYNVWLSPVAPDAGRAEEVARVVEQVTTPATIFRYNIVGFELPWFNANTFNYYAAQERLRKGYRLYFTNLGHAETDVTRAARRVETFQAAYYLALEPPVRPHDAIDPHNRTSDAVADQVARDRRFRREPFASDYGIVLLRRLPPACPKTKGRP